MLDARSLEERADHYFNREEVSELKLAGAFNIGLYEWTNCSGYYWQVEFEALACSSSSIKDVARRLTEIITPDESISKPVNLESSECRSGSTGSLRSHAELYLLDGHDGDLIDTGPLPDWAEREFALFLENNTCPVDARQYFKNVPWKKCGRIKVPKLD